jgi:hypothetical protein
MTKLSPKTVRSRINKVIEKIKTLEKEIASIKSRCTHDWQYESDPSGNNDSGYYCSYCNGWRNRLP